MILVWVCDRYALHVIQELSGCGAILLLCLLSSYFCFQFLCCYLFEVSLWGGISSILLFRYWCVRVLCGVRLLAVFFYLCLISHLWDMCICWFSGCFLWSVCLARPDVLHICPDSSVSIVCTVSFCAIRNRLPFVFLSILSLVRFTSV